MGKSLFAADYAHQGEVHVLMRGEQLSLSGFLGELRPCKRTFEPYSEQQRRYFATRAKDYMLRRGPRTIMGTLGTSSLPLTGKGA